MHVPGHLWSSSAPPGLITASILSGFDQNLEKKTVQTRPTDQPTNRTLFTMTSPSTSPGETPAENVPQMPWMFTRDVHPRLDMSTPLRVLVGSFVAAFVGFSLGSTKGGQSAELRFRAEHAHKMPDSTTGWYLYHKSKNYHIMQGGIQEGARMGSRIGFWSFMALSLESTIDRARGASDMFSTIIASLTVSGAFSLWRKS